MGKVVEHFKTTDSDFLWDRVTSAQGLSPRVFSCGSVYNSILQMYNSNIFFISLNHNNLKLADSDRNRIFQSIYQHEGSIDGTEFFDDLDSGNKVAVHSRQVYLVHWSLR